MRFKCLLILPLLVPSLQAASVSDLTFTLNGDGTEYSVSDCDPTSGPLVIPNTYNGLPVTSIGNDALAGIDIASITIPDSVTSIGNNAFYGCYYLESITIPNSVTTIGEGAMQYCNNLTSVTLPNGLTSIKNRTFINSYSLNNINIPDSVTSIGSSAFRSCSGLKSITIPDSVTSIGDYAFEDCYTLRSITIPDSVTSIGDYAFANCGFLASITFEGDAPALGADIFQAINRGNPVTIYYNPNKSGWSNTVAGRPAIPYDNIGSRQYLRVTGTLTNYENLNIGQEIELFLHVNNGTVQYENFNYDTAAQSLEASVTGSSFWDSISSNLFGSTTRGELGQNGIRHNLYMNAQSSYFKLEINGFSDGIGLAFNNGEVIADVTRLEILIRNDEYNLGWNSAPSSSSTLSDVLNYNTTDYIPTMDPLDTLDLEKRGKISIDVEGVGRLVFSMTKLSIVPVPENVFTFQGSSYQIIESNYTWEQARLDAISRGGHLVSLSSQAEDNAVANSGIYLDFRSNDGGLVWLGAESFAGTGGSASWQWVTGEEISYDTYDNWYMGLTTSAYYSGNVGWAAYLTYGSGGQEWTPINKDGGYYGSYMLETPLSNSTEIDTDGDGIYDNSETNTGVYVSESNTGTDPFNPDSDGDSLNDGLETNTGTFVSATDTGTDPNNADSDGDGLNDGIETNSGVFVSFTDTGTDPNSADTLHTPAEMATARSESRTLGQTDVTGNPSQYGLFTSSDLSDAQSSSRTAGQQDVTSSPSDYNLMGAEGVFDMRVSQPGISTDGDMASMNFTIQSSNDLEQWNNEETIRREYTMPSDKNFMRISVGPQLEPEPESLPSIATDTYGDRLVYDESNNLYVNDENTPLMKDGVNLRTDTYAQYGYNFYAIESTSSGYLCLLKSPNQNAIMTLSLDGNYLSVSLINDLSAYESDFGQSLD